MSSSSTEIEDSIKIRVDTTKKCVMKPKAELITSEYIWRPAKQADLKFLNQHFSESLKNFDQLTLENVLANSFASFVCLGPQEKIIGFIAFDHNPLIPDFLPRSWMDWINYHFLSTDSDPKLNQENFMFITVLLWDEDQFFSIDKPLENCFLIHKKLEHILMISSQNTESFLIHKLFQSKFKQIEQNTREGSSDNFLNLNICSRDLNSCPRLSLRETLERDNDSLHNIFNTCSPKVEAKYGRFFFAEIVRNYNKSIGVITGLLDEAIVGGIYVKITKKLVYINENFNLKPFYPHNCDLAEEKTTCMIHLYGLKENCDKQLGYDFLVGVFESLSVVTHCLISLPTVRRCEELLKHFVKVPKHPTPSSFGQELYYLSIHSILCEFYVRQAQIDDFEAFHHHTKSMQNRPKILAIYQDYLEKQNIDSNMIFFLLCKNVIIGFCMVSAALDVKTLKDNFHLEKFVNFKVHKDVEHHGVVDYFHINLPFSTQFSFFITQIANQSTFKNFYTELKINENEAPSNSELWRMIPVKPKRVRNKLKCNTALYFTSPRQSLISKEHININIVLVGSSSTAMSFLETLIFHEKYQNMWFTNISLISKNGLQNYVDLLPSQKYSIDENYLARLGLNTWVTIIPGTVTSINLREKQVMIDDNAKLSYDVLYLFTGMEFGYPKSIARLRDGQIIPKNFFALNNEWDVENFKKVLEDTVKEDFEDDIIVYGSCLDSISILNHILLSGVPSDKIKVVRPWFQPVELDDENVRDELDRTLLDYGVEMETDYNLIEWGVNQSNEIKMIRFENENASTRFELRCCFLVCLETKNVSAQNLKMFMKSNLKFYCGQLFIDSKFRTNDPHVFAGGPGTIYQLLLHADKLKHQYFSSREIGEIMAHNFMQESNNLSNLPPTPKKPLIQSAKFPGNLNYLNIRPAVYNFDQLRFFDTNFVACPQDVNYLKVGVSLSGAIKSVLCLTKRELKVEIFEKIVGKNSALFKNFHGKSSIGSIRDLFGFFEHPRFRAVFHEDFEEFEKMLSYDRDLKDLEDVRKRVQEELMEFLENHKDEFPMYVLK